MVTPLAAYQRWVSMNLGSVSVSNCNRVFSAMPIRHGITRSRNNVLQPSNSTTTGRSSIEKIDSCQAGGSASVVSLNQ
jgi:hypothetical protein